MIVTQEYTQRPVWSKPLQPIVLISDLDTLIALAQIERERSFGLQDNMPGTCPGCVIHEYAPSVPRSILKCRGQVDDRTNSRKVFHLSAAEAAHRRRSRSDSDSDIEKAQVFIALIHPASPKTI